MRHQRLRAMAKIGIRSTPVLAIGVCTAAAVAYAVRWHQSIRRSGRAPFTLVASPRAQSVAAGETARYRISIRKGRYRGRVKLRVISAAPTHISAGAASLRNRVSLAVRRQSATLSVRTALSDFVGSYAVKIKAIGGRFRAQLTVKLRIVSPPPAAFNIAGNFGPVWPGTAQAVDLALTNPNPEAISVRSLTVGIESVRAPRATNALPCSARDFSVRQFTGPYPLKVPASATVHLSDLGVPPTEGPRLVMLDRPVNQDGCQGATVTLSYSGKAASP